MDTLQNVYKFCLYYSYKMRIPEYNLPLPLVVFYTAEHYRYFVLRQTHK